MPYRDLREFLARLEELKELKRVKQKVHWRYEIGAWIRHSDDLKGPSLIFENIQDYSSPFCAGCIGNYLRMATALDLDPDTPVQELIQIFKDRLQHPLKPNLVSTGPVKENIHIGDEVDLFEFPTPWWHPRDGGRFIGTWDSVISKDPASKRISLGTYRVQIQGENSCSVGFLPGQPIGGHFIQKGVEKEPLEIAIVIGCDEAVIMASASGISPTASKYEVAGGLRREPIDLVKCETVDLEIPANAEIVLEGKLYTGLEDRMPEGPFGEYVGYHADGIRMRPKVEITAITYRSNPILRGTLVGKPLSEAAIFSNIQIAANGLKMFEERGPAGIKAINNLPEAGGLLVTLIQMTPFYVGHSREVARVWLSSPVGAFSKIVIIVDDDIDPFDLGQVFWALGSRTQGSRDVEIWNFCKSSRSDPSVLRHKGEYTDRVIIDATKKLDYPYVKQYNGHWAPVATPPKEIMELVELKWKKEFGQPFLEDKIRQKEEELKAFHNKWEKWRNDYYSFTEEEKLK